LDPIHYWQQECAQWSPDDLVVIDGLMELGLEGKYFVKPSNSFNYRAKTNTRIYGTGRDHRVDIFQPMFNTLGERVTVIQTVRIQMSEELDNWGTDAWLDRPSHNTFSQEIPPGFAPTVVWKLPDLDLDSWLPDL
jgi:hypothetical protein